MTENTSAASPSPRENTGSSAVLYVPDRADRAHNYFRLGNPNSTHETGLPPDISKLDTPGTSQVSAYAKGALLYTTGTFEVTAPTTYIVSPSLVMDATSSDDDPPDDSGITTFSPNTLTAVLSGSQLCSASLTTNGKSASIFHNRPANVTFQNVDQLTMTEGDASNFLTGNSLTFWTGNDQSIGFGGLLWANMGITSNIFGGTIINLTNTSAEVQGLGEFKATVDHEVAAATSITLNVTPTTAASLSLATTVTKIMNGVMALGTLVAAAYSGGVLTEINAFTDHDAKGLKDRMTKTNEDLETMTMLVVGVQALSVLLAVVLQLGRRAPKTVTSQLNLTDASCSLSAGMSKMTMTTAAITLEANDPLASVELSAGTTIVVRAPDAISLMCTPAARIELTPTSVTLTAGPSSIVLGPQGITMNGVQVNTNALQAGFVPAILPPPLPAPQVVAAIAVAGAQVVALAAVDAAT